MDASSSGGERVLYRRLPREATWLDYVCRAAEGEEVALACLYDETSSLVYGLAMRMLANIEDAEEVTLDVYNQVWRSAKSFDGQRGTVTAWLMTMTRTRALDRLRARASRQKNVEPISEQFEMPGFGATPEEETALSQQRRIVLRALEQLPGDQRKALEMAYFQGLSHSELAVALGEPLGTIKTRIRLGMMKLRDLLEEAASGSLKAHS